VAVKMIGPTALVTEAACRRRRQTQRLGRTDRNRSVLWQLLLLTDRPGREEIPRPAPYPRSAIHLCLALPWKGEHLLGE